MSTTRRPLGHGPVPVVEDQEQRVARGRTAAEQAATDTPPTAPGRPESSPARRVLGHGART
ncbi:hypothetical protein [Streptomyces goshikiensis]|uniref:hypothetical protein n=1 Tax=Streptomyces goshikiensis TaxID=1942 RepID=UPI002ADF77E1|nr:hypothetical protein [Streptomyces goshikiensis]